MLLSQTIGLTAVSAVVAIRGQGPPDAGRLLAAAAGGIGGVVGLTAFYRALAIGTMSIVAPIAATGVCVPVLVGIAGGEHPAALKLAGIAVAVVGVALASRESAEPRDSASTHTRASVFLALIAALGFGAM